MIRLTSTVGGNTAQTAETNGINFEKMFRFLWKDLTPLLSELIFFVKPRSYETKVATLYTWLKRNVNAGHTVSKSWQSDEAGLNVPFNKGERMIIVHAGTKDGLGYPRC